MKIARMVSLLAAVAWLAAPAASSWAYPPGVGILANNRSCLSCHVSTGPWADEARTIIDVVDATTKRSLRGADGAFYIDVPRGELRTVLTVIARKKGDAAVPRRNAWLFVDPTRIATSALSKFAPGWEVNLPMACRVTGDKVDGYDAAGLTVLPMTVRPTDAARDAELELQVMLTAGEAVKGKGKEGLVANYLVRRVLVRVIDR